MQIWKTEIWDLLISVSLPLSLPLLKCKSWERWQKHHSHMVSKLTQMLSPYHPLTHTHVSPLTYLSSSFTAVISSIFTRALLSLPLLTHTITETALSSHIISPYWQKTPALDVLQTVFLFQNGSHTHEIGIVNNYIYSALFLIFFTPSSLATASW